LLELGAASQHQPQPKPLAISFLFLFIPTLYKIKTGEFLLLLGGDVAYDLKLVQ
jgi:hypothetical protein